MSATLTHPYQHGLAWFKRWFTGKPHQVIGDGSPYLLRWYVIPRNPLLNIYVHKFLRSDDDRALHDHPWWFVSLVLRGGYVEVHEADHGKTMALCRTSILDWGSPFRSRMVAFRPATWRHRVVLPHELRQVQYADGTWSRETQMVEKPCWTLIVTGPKVREWGFWCKDTVPATFRSLGMPTERFVHWRDWGEGGCGETA